MVAGTPPATIMAEDGLMAKAKPFPLTVDTRVDAPSKAMIDDIASGTDRRRRAVGPIGGYYATGGEPDLSVTPLLQEQGVPMDFRIAMGVRHSDQEWKRTLNRLIARQPGCDRQIARGLWRPAA